jgi:hypothetical protein
MKSFFTISVLALLFSQSPAQERDLSGYEKMERTIDETKEDSAPYVAKQREFIWDCWKQTRRCFAYLKVELKDTSPSVIQIFIEPDEKGVWNAAYMADAQLLDKNRKPKGKPVSLRYSSLKIVRIEASDSFKKIKEIPEDEVRTADTYRIYLKSTRGAIKEILFGGPNGLIF